MTEPLHTFVSVAHAVAYLHAHGYDTVLEDAGTNHDRLMRSPVGDIAVIRKTGFLTVEVYEDSGYWADKLSDWASDAVDFF